MRAAGTSDNKSILGSRRKGQEVLIEDGVAKMRDRQSFAGSIATADRLVRNMHQMGGATIEEAVKMMSTVPARIMGCDHCKGKLKRNYDADIIVFDSDIAVKNVFINGILKM